MTVTDTTLAPVDKLSRELAKTGGGLDREQARALVDMYYRFQEHRIALRGQERAAVQGADPGAETLLLDHFAVQMETLERQMVRVLDNWTDSIEVGRWAKSQLGIGPVLAAGLSAHIDITRARTAGAIWRYAGLDPTVRWGKGEKRPWNADLKVLCWKIGDSFVKVSGREDAYYGKVYRERKAYELARDGSGGNADAAAAKLTEKRITDAGLKKTLESGHLSAGQLDLRARRYATKLFLSHWHAVAYEAEYGEPPLLPYPIAHLGHAHVIPVPGATSE